MKPRRTAFDWPKKGRYALYPCTRPSSGAAKSSEKAVSKNKSPRQISIFRSLLGNA
jgi:hypothetical protein